MTLTRQSTENRHTINFSVLDIVHLASQKYWLFDCCVKLFLTNNGIHIFLSIYYRGCSCSCVPKRGNITLFADLGKLLEVSCHYFRLYAFFIWIFISWFSAERKKICENRVHMCMTNDQSVKIGKNFAEKDEYWLVYIKSIRFSFSLH